MGREKHTESAFNTAYSVSILAQASFSFRFNKATCYDTNPYTILGTKDHTDAQFMMPAHTFDVSFESVTPPYPEVTDAGEAGYLHRLRKRTVRVSLFEEATKPEDSDHRDEVEHAVVFEYRAKPTLAVRFPGAPEDAALKCTKWAGTKMGEPLTIKVAQSHMPKRKLKAGEEVAPVVDVRETLKMGDTTPCSHVEGTVQIHSMLGIGQVDLGHVLVSRRRAND